MHLMQSFSSKVTRLLRPASFLIKDFSRAFLQNLLTIKRSLPNNVKPNTVFTGAKLSFNFNVKDPVPFTEKYDVIYRSVCATENCNKDYVGECARRL